MEDRDSIARRISALVELGLTPVESPPLPVESVKVGWRKYKVSESRPSMGTLVTITTVASSAGRAQEAVGRAFEETERLVGILSRHDTTSPVSYLNREGSIEGMPPEMQRVVAGAMHYHSLSGGTFDVTVKPLLDLFESRKTGTGYSEPGEEEIREVLERTGAGHVEFTGRALRFRREGMGMTLDGIAKGYIVDSAAGVLLRHGVKNFLVNAGGDIRTGGRREDGKPWTVAVQDPQKMGEYPDIIHLTSGAVATSGSYEIYFDPEMRHHHIVDTGSGRSPGRKASVSVIAPTAMEADAVATTLFIMKPERGVGLVDSRPGIEALIVDFTGEQIRSRGWKSAVK